MYSTRHLGFLKRVPTATADYLLRPGELAAAFAGWQLLYQEEDAEDAGDAAAAGQPAAGA